MWVEIGPEEEDRMEWRFDSPPAKAGNSCTFSGSSFVDKLAKFLWAKKEINGKIWRKCSENCVKKEEYNHKNRR